MPKLIYPAVLERGDSKTFAVWLPDFPDCVAAGTSPEEAIEKAQHLVAKAIYTLAEGEVPPPAPSPFERIALPKNCDFVAFFAVTVDGPDPSERVNVYLPRSLLAQADARAQQLGMSRSSFFGFALSNALGFFGARGRLLAQVAAGKPPAYPIMKVRRKRRTR